MQYKDLLALVGAAITIGAALPYIRDTLNHKTKPHVITWLIWTILASTGCAIQIVGGGGIGSVVLGITAIMNIIILICAYRVARPNVTQFDFLVLILALLALIAWRVTSSANVSAILITSVMVLGYIPTYIKSWRSPEQETMSLFFLSGVKQLIGIAALSAYNLLTLLFPAVLVGANFGLVFLLIIRRRTVSG